MPLLPLQQQESNVDEESISFPPSALVEASRLTKEGTILLQKRSPLELTALLSVCPEGLLVMIVVVSGVLPTLSSVASMPENAVAKYGQVNDMSKVLNLKKR